MGATRPTTYGGAISVSNSQSLALLDVTGMPPGTLVWNEDVGAFFKLSVCARRTIELDPTDTYDAGVWTFANGDFTEEDAEDTLVIQFSGLNSGYNGNYFITAVNSATEIEALPAPADASTFPFEGAATVVATGPSVADVTVSVQGGAIFGLVWRVFEVGSDPTVETVNQLAALTDFRSPALEDAATSITVSDLTGNADGDYEVYFHLVIDAIASGVITLQINGADTNLYSTWSNIAAATLTGARSTTTCELAPSTTQADIVSGWIKIRSKTGFDFRTGSYQTITATGPTTRTGVFTYTDSATEITSLSITAGADAFGVGSFMMVRKLHHQY